VTGSAHAEWSALLRRNSGLLDPAIDRFAAAQFLMIAELDRAVENFRRHRKNFAVLGNEIIGRIGGGCGGGGDGPGDGIEGRAHLSIAG
jgi:hypothetical protein